MIDYYICSKNIALQYCKGAEYKAVVYSGITDKIHLDYRHWSSIDSLLVKGIAADMQLMLTLADPLFRTVTYTDMSVLLFQDINAEWNILK